MKTRTLLKTAAILLIAGAMVRAANVPQSLPFAQAWTNVGLITANDNWSAVPGIEGYLGQDITTATGADPQTLLGVSAVANDLDVIANQSNPGISNGGVAEFDGIPNPTIALNGSGTADAPYIVLYLNTIGQSNITVAYNLRDLDASADNSIQPVALQYRVGSTGNFTNIPAGFVADATIGPSLATLVTPVSVTLPPAADNQPEVQVRVITSNAAGNDEWVGVDDIQVSSGGGDPTLTINDISVTEGAAGISFATFTVSLSSPAGASGVTFDVATQDNTATTADNDYVAQSFTDQAIAAGGSSYTFSVSINGDAFVEPNETYFVNVTNVVGAIAGDGQGVGTILNDDVTLTKIHDIQGAGATSPLVSAVVSARGIVTGVKNNGFFFQEPPESVDADPATSEALFVFTGSPAPAAAVRGNFVQVTGTVTEFVPAADPLQPPLTQLAGSVGITLLSTGQPLPAPIDLTAADANPAGPFDQLEKFENMLVRVASLTVSGATLGSITEPSATASSSGVFYGVITGLGRPFREPGIQVPDPLPAGSPAGVPRFDTNPQRIRVDSDAQAGAPVLDVAVGAVVTNLVGPLDYSFRTYTILPDPTVTATVTGGASPRAVRTPDPAELTIASSNVERFFDTVNDPGIGEPVLTAAAFDTRLNKASLWIRQILKTPDIVGLVEVENLTTLEALAARVSADAIAAGQSDPLYDAFLFEGNDIGGIDVGFLVKTSAVGSTPRVQVSSVTQVGLTDTYINPNTGLPETLHDRPPVVLQAIVRFASRSPFPVTVIVNHNRSLLDLGDETPSGSGTVGARVRAKRAAQAEFLANLVQARQTANPNERIVLVGDFNAYEFSDGYVDVMGTIKGTPAPSDQVVRATPDLVNPNLINLMEQLPAPERYSYVFDGNAQVIDHILINSATASFVREIAMARGNADLPETARNNGTVPNRLSDHDAPVVYLRSLPLDVTAQVRLIQTPLVFNPITHISHGVIVIMNRGESTLNAPLHFVFEDLPAGVTLLNADGTVGDDPYLLVPGGSLPPRRTTVLMVAFSNPNHVTITYTPRIFSGAF